MEENQLPLFLGQVRGVGGQFDTRAPVAVDGTTEQGQLGRDRLRLALH